MKDQLNNDEDPFRPIEDKSTKAGLLIVMLIVCAFILGLIVGFAFGRA